LSTPEQRGLEVNEALLDLEERFGGLVIPHSHDPSAIGQLMFGVFQMLCVPPKLRRRLRWDGEEEVELEPTTWPQMRYQHDVLTLVGLQHVEERLYCDGGGTIYRYAGEVDLFRAEAGSAAGFFELMGLRAHAARTIGQIAWLRIDADVGDRIAKELGLERVREVTDHVAAHWLSESHWVWRQSSFGPNEPATFFVAASPSLVVEGARRMLSLAPKGKLKLQTAGPGGAARLEALQAEGIVVAG
jgi:hypothetical protein